MNFLEETRATINVANKTLTLEETLAIKFSHQAKSTNQQTPRLHPQNTKTKARRTHKPSNPGSKSGKRQAMSRPHQRQAYMRCPDQYFPSPRIRRGHLQYQRHPATIGVLQEPSEATPG